ncbi:Hypothetical predicted protein [Paramuricea clavata]|uniref:Uncharacterized protein n=1 Tax=Paramuricea clavata TaxID=317549 RepID=A0A6S7H8A5_PARCT|nr:Hypothetical predicted protein [Paramuricea clavata]
MANAVDILICWGNDDEIANLWSVECIMMVKVNGMKYEDRHWSVYETGRYLVASLDGKRKPGKGSASSLPPRCSVSRYRTFTKGLRSNGGFRGMK